MAKENPMAIPGGAGLRAATNKALANSAKGKLQTPTAEAARRAGKITGEGGKNVTPIYKQSIPPASVKVIPANSKPRTPANDQAVKDAYQKYLTMFGKNK